MLKTSNKYEYMSCENLWFTAKEELRGTVIALQAYMRKE